MKSQKARLLMKLIVPVVTVFWSFSVTCPSAMAQNSNNSAEIENLKLIVDQQQKALEQQQAQIQALQSALTEQKKVLVSLVQGAASSDTANPPIYPKTDNQLQVQNQPSSVPNEQQPLTPQQTQVEEELQRGPEIADVTPTTPALQLGPAKIRLIGYPALTSVWRSTNNGGNVATNFNNIPYDNTVPGTTSEFRLSPQSTRLALRVDADLKIQPNRWIFRDGFCRCTRRRKSCDAIRLSVPDSSGLVGLAQRKVGDDRRAVVVADDTE